MLTTWPNVAMTILTMLAMVLLASPLVLQEEDKWCMQLCLLRKCVETWYLHHHAMSTICAVTETSDTPLFHAGALRSLSSQLTDVPIVQKCKDDNQDSDLG
jgi:hypothetical protein